jgi:hypothetical protein
MKAGIILFIAAMSCLLFGIIFRLQHWPLAGLFFIIHILLWPIGLLTFLIATLSHPRFHDLMNVRYGPLKARSLVHALIVLTGLTVIVNLGALFKIPDWPLGGTVWWGFSLVAVALVWLFMRYSGRKRPADRSLKL